MDASDTVKSAASAPDGKKLCQYYQTLVNHRAAWDTLWTEIADYVIPRRAPGMMGTILSPTTEIESRLFDNTAVQAVQINAAGCVAWMSPADSAWFNFSPPSTNEDDAVKRFLQRASQTGREVMARSNFYNAIHEAYMDGAAFGTMCVYGEPDEDDAVFFQHWPVGTYVIAEDHRGRVNTVIREFKLTAEQAGEKFGKENLPKKIQSCIEKGGQNLLTKFDFLHFIMPRSQADQKRQGTPQQRMPVACYYVTKDDEKVVKESGYLRMPVFVSRYLEWGTGTGGVYGWAPAFSALPEARQVNFLQKFMDALAEKMAFPPWLVPDDFEGEFDPNAAAVNFFAKGLQAHELPREVPPTGRYDVGKDRVMERQRAIREAFHVDMFQMFGSMEKTGQMTAREVAERTAEKLVQFSPTFARRTSELLSPLLRWLFLELLGQGQFGGIEQIPPSLKSPDGKSIALPNIQFTSRIALAMQQLPTIGLWRTLELAATIVQASGNPAVMDNIEWDKAIRQAALTNGVSADVMVPDHKVRELREARAAAQQQAEQMEMMTAGADVANKLGSIPAESPVLKAVA